MSDLKTIKEKVKRFCIKRDLDTSIEIRMLDLASEIGELSKEIIKGSNYGKDKFKVTDNTKLELGDVFFVIILLSIQLDLDLEESLDMALNKYNSRMINGNIGSK